MQDNRVLSGMRPTGRLHLGHYHGVLKNWLDLQNEYDSYFFVADWHAFTTHYSDKIDLETNVMEMVVDWLAAGINPNTSTIFVQSKVPEHAELHLLLSMSTPLSWLERVPSYKDQQLKLKTKDLGTYGFLGYPLLQSADILMYKAGLVPVGEDQVAHVELTREVARRFNYLYGREAGFEEKAEAAITKMGKKKAKSYRSLRKAYQETGDTEALVKAQALLKQQQNITLGDRERLSGYIEGVGRIILPEPESLLTKASKMPGLDGQKMSKSYGNTITLRDTEDEITTKVKRMPTDPARVKLTDPGDPNKCPVWQLHKVYSDESTCEWVVEGCTKAKMGCIECKQPVIDAIKDELMPMQERIAKYQADPELIKQIIHEGSEKARNVAKETMVEVR
ncbi:MAG: tryptophan--tRNA ligase, partial [Candidatus Thioglobus sp.]